MKLNYKLFFLLLIILTSCAKKLTENELPKVKREKTQNLLATLDSLSQIRPKTFYSKISTKYQDTTRNISVKTSLRMVADSAINMIVTYAAIPVVNAVITPDSVKVVNKKEKCVVRADMAFIQENFGVEFSFRNIEEMILGIPLDYDTTQKYFQIHEPYRYVISSHRKRKIKKNERLEKQEESVAVKYFINREKNQLEGLEIISASDTTSIYVSYTTRQLIGGINVPEIVSINVISPRNNLLMELSYEKVTVNEPVELYFIVPEDYEICE
jgi:Domain of unknown function (DUF4292)